MQQRGPIALNFCRRRRRRRHPTVCPAWRCPHPCSFNKREEDFATKQEFDDYLEEREDISERRLAACRNQQQFCGVRCCGQSWQSGHAGGPRLYPPPMPPVHPPAPAVFNLVEGIDVKDMERRVEEYRRANADSIVRNDALRAEELRRRAAASEEGAGHAGVSGTAAAFHEGADAEPHQGMEYTAALPEAAAAALGTCVAARLALLAWLRQPLLCLFLATLSVAHFTQLPCLSYCPACRGPAPLPLGLAPDVDGNLQAAAGGGQLSSEAWLQMGLSSGWRQDMPKRKALEQAFGSVLLF